MNMLNKPVPVPHEEAFQLPGAPFTNTDDNGYVVSSRTLLWL